MVSFTPRRAVPMRIRDWETPSRSAQRRRTSAPGSSVANTADYVAMRAARLSNKFSVAAPSTRGTLKQQVKALQSWTRKQSPELKFLDTTLAVANMPITGSVLNIVGIAQGTNSSDRIGDTVNVTSVAIKGQLGPDTDSFSRFYHRVLIVLDKQAVSDTLPTAANIISDAVTTADPIICLPNPQNTERFTILWMSELFDNGLGCGQNSFNDVSFQQSGAFEGTWSGNVKVSYNGTAGTDFQKNAIYVVHLTNSTAATMDWTGVARVTYTDA